MGLKECEEDYEHTKDLLAKLMGLVSNGPNDTVTAFVQELKDQGFGLSPESVITGESVSLIASGYEWMCPNCDYLNTEIEIVEVVKCRECYHVYNTDEPDHACGD